MNVSRNKVRDTNFEVPVQHFRYSGAGINIASQLASGFSPFNERLNPIHSIKEEKNLGDNPVAFVYLIYLKRIRDTAHPASLDLWYC